MSSVYIINYLHRVLSHSAIQASISTPAYMPVNKLVTCELLFFGYVEKIH